MPWRRESLPTPLFWPREFHGLHSLWGRKESDMTEQLSLSKKITSRTMLFKNCNCSMYCYTIISESVSVQWEKRRKYVHVCVLSRFSPVRLFATSGTVTCQAPLSIGFSRQKYWSGLPCPPPGNLPNPGIEPVSRTSPAFQADSLPLSHWGSPSCPQKLGKLCYYMTIATHT